MYCSDILLHKSDSTFPIPEQICFTSMPFLKCVSFSVKIRYSRCNNHLFFVFIVGHLSFQGAFMSSC